MEWRAEKLEVETKVGNAHNRRVSLVAGAIVLAIVSALPGVSAANPPQFAELVAAGRDTLSRVQFFEDEGREHVPPDRSVAYPAIPPTSGAHYDRWAEPGVYDTIQPRELLVHALEHGNIVIYVDQTKSIPDELTAWSRSFNGQWDGIVVTRLPGIGEKVILTAWRRKLELDAFEPSAAAAFIDAFRGRGPENPVR